MNLRAEETTVEDEVSERYYLNSWPVLASSPRSELIPHELWKVHPHLCRSQLV